MGSAIGFIEEPLDVVWGLCRAWRDGLGRPYSTEDLGEMPIIEQVKHLEPLEMPYARRLLVATQGNWTAYVDNAINGGDPPPWVGYLSRELSCRGVVARHVPREQYPYPSTQFELLGPDGTPPLYFIRTVSAGIYDSGRWSFQAHGAIQPFEDTAGYALRRKRDRFPRSTLVRYLQALGIQVDDPSFYGAGRLVQENENAGWERRTLTLEQARHEHTSDL